MNKPQAWVEIIRSLLFGRVRSLRASVYGKMVTVPDEMLAHALILALKFAAIQDMLTPEMLAVVGQMDRALNPPDLPSVQPEQTL